MSNPAIEPSQGCYLMPSLKQGRVRDAMHPGIVSCQRDAPLRQVARTMAAHQVHCIAVIDLSDDSFIWEIISDLDLVRMGSRSSEQVSAGAIASHPVIGVKPTLPLPEAADLMLTRGVSHLVVVDPENEPPYRDSLQSGPGPRPRVGPSLTTTSFGQPAVGRRGRRSRCSPQDARKRR
jgi:CBS domain-containing protein